MRLSIIVPTLNVAGNIAAALDWCTWVGEALRDVDEPAGLDGII